MKKGNTPYHHGDLPRTLVKTTLQIIAEQGLAGVTMREVSRRIGVSRTAAYRHYQNKQELLCAVAEQGFRDLADRFKAIVDQGGASALETLVAIGLGYLDYALANPALYRLMFGSTLTQTERPPSLRDAAEQAFGQFQTMVERGQAQGLFRAGDTLAYASILWSLMHGLARLLMDGQLQTENQGDGLPILLTDNLGKTQRDAGNLMAVVVDVLLLGLAPRDGGA